VIVFFCDQAHRYTLGAVLRSPGRRVHVEVRSYAWLFSRNRIPGATYVFTDHERLADHELTAAARAFRQMKEAGLKVLNDPARVRVRLELLEELHRCGINQFTAYRAASRPRPHKFPVFLRKETDHTLFSDELIGDQETLDMRLQSLERDGIPLRHVLVVEFSAEPARPGVYRRQAVFKIGERLIAASPLVENRWAVKYGTPGLSTDEELAAAAEVIDRNPYGDRLRPAFDVGRIDYGRADFGLAGGRLSVFEINTNPRIADVGGHRHAAYQAACKRVHERVVEAIDALDTAPPPVPLTWDLPRASRLRRLFGSGLRRP
jgi:hypothetical protein